MSRRRSSSYAALIVVVALLALGSFSARSRGQSTGGQDDSIDRLLVDKSEHTMEARSHGRLLATYRVAIGRGGDGPKRREGDERTPEGTYTIDSRHASRAYHRFLHVSYPNGDDRAAFERLIGDGTFPRAARIGGAIGVHGTGASSLVRAAHTVRMDWTAGCIAVTDAEIDHLYAAVRPDAQIVIRP